MSLINEGKTILSGKAPLPVLPINGGGGAAAPMRPKRLADSFQISMAAAVLGCTYTEQIVPLFH